MQSSRFSDFYNKTGVDIMAPMRSLRCGVIGLGAIYKNHAEAIVSADNALLAAVCDTKRYALFKAHRIYGARTYTDYRKMIEKENLDVVHICLPHYLHKEVALYALSRGINVVLEKPMGISAEEVSEIMDAKEKSSAKLCVIMQNRYNDASRALKDMLLSGKMGKIEDAEIKVMWKRTKEYYSKSDWRGRFKTEGGGACINQAIHTLDLLLWFADSKIKNISASLETLTHDIEVEDHAEGIIEFESGLSARFEFSNNEDDNYPVEVILKCEKAKAHMWATKLEVEFENGEKFECGEDIRKSEKGYWGESHKRQILDFYSYIQGGSKPFVTPEDVTDTHLAVYEILSKRK